MGASSSKNKALAADTDPSQSNPSETADLPTAPPPLHSPDHDQPASAVTPADSHALPAEQELDESASASGSNDAPAVAPLRGDAKGAVEIPGKKKVEVIRVHNPEDYEDDTNQTGLSHYEIKIQDKFYSAPNRQRSKAYTDQVNADKAKKAAKAEKKAEKAAKKKKKKDKDSDVLIPNTVDWAIDNTKKLGILNLSKMDLDSVPDAVFESMPGTARIINISFNRISQLDRRLCDYVLVQRLIANGNFLSSIPQSISRMTALKKLDLARNKLKSLPDAFEGMRHLEHVDLSENMLNELPPSFATLNLTALNLSRNKFSIAPLEVASMEWLMDLDLSANQLTAVPDEYMALRHLIALKLDSNSISDFPDSMLQLCTELVTLRLRNNPIKMSVLECKEPYAAFSERRQIKFKRQLDAGTLALQDLNPADD